MLPIGVVGRVFQPPGSGKRTLKEEMVMATSDFDVQAFARLRGKEAGRAVNWAMLASLILFLTGLFLLLGQQALAAI